MANPSTNMSGAVTRSRGPCKRVGARYRERTAAGYLSRPGRATSVTPRARWERPADVKANRRNVSILANNRVVFNIKGNDHRLVVAMRYDKQIIFIRFIGTHAEYDRIDATTV
jgi:mRNA interferase HigB